MVKCDKCDGDGWIHHSKGGQGGDAKSCKKCGGTGKISTRPRCFKCEGKGYINQAIFAAYSDRSGKSEKCDECNGKGTL